MVCAGAERAALRAMNCNALKVCDSLIEGFSQIAIEIRIRCIDVLQVAIDVFELDVRGREGAYVAASACPWNPGSRRVRRRIRAIWRNHEIVRVVCAIDDVRPVLERGSEPD